MSFKRERKHYCRYAVAGALVGGVCVGFANHLQNTSYDSAGNKLTRL